MKFVTASNGFIDLMGDGSGEAAHGSKAFASVQSRFHLALPSDITHDLGRPDDPAAIANG